MQNLLSGTFLFLISTWAGAAVGQMEDAASAPSEMVSVAYVALFAILFVGMIVWFFIHMWKNEKNKKQDD